MLISLPQLRNDSLITTEEARFLNRYCPVKYGWHMVYFKLRRNSNAGALKIHLVNQLRLDIGQEKTNQ